MMFELVIAVIAFSSATIFVAHVLEPYLTQQKLAWVAKRENPPGLRPAGAGEFSFDAASHVRDDR